MNSAKLIFNEIDQSFFVDSLQQGLGAVLVRTKRGPFRHDGTIINNWPDFVKKYGGETTSFDGPSIVKRALESGAKLRIGKVGHYTSPSSASSLDAVLGSLDETVASFAVDGSDELFDLTVKYPGADYNNLRVVIANASNGDADSFNLSINHIVETDLNRTYQNIKIVGSPTVADSVYLKEVQEQDLWFDVTYKNLSALTGPLRPVNGSWAVTSGTDGTTPVDADYSGDSAGKTGWYMFDEQDDFNALVSLDNYSSAVMVTGAAYSANRADHFNFHYFADSINTTTALGSARVATNIDSRYSVFFAGGLKIPHPTLASPATKNIAAIGDILGTAMKSNTAVGPWWSFAGTQRGVIQSALGVINNFPTTAKLDELAQKQINAVIQSKGKIYIKGNFSAQQATSRKSFVSVVGLIIFLKKSLAPIMERYLEEPCDFQTFKSIYNEANPFLDSLVGGDKRALMDYSYKGDQFANSNADLRINTPSDIAQGKYKVKLFLKEVVSLQEFTLDIISAAATVEFKDDL